MTKKNQIFFLEPGNAESFVLKGIKIDQLLPQVLGRLSLMGKIMS